MSVSIGSSVELKRISPEMASSLLNKNKRNRAIKPGNIEKFAAAMKAGEWDINGETIKISEEGNLLDGQNRLYACVKAGVPFDTWVVYNVPEEMMDTIDIGAARTPADHLTFLYGDQYSIGHIRAVSGGITWYTHLRNGTVRKGMPNEWHAQVCQTYPVIWTIGHRVYKVSPADRLMPPGPFIGAWLACWCLEPALADEFFPPVIEGEDLLAGSIEAIARHRVMRWASRRPVDREPPDRTIYEILKCWNSIRRRRAFTKRDSAVYRSTDGRVVPI